MSGLSLNNLKNDSFSNPCPPVTTRTRIFSAVTVAASAAEATSRVSMAKVRRLPSIMREVFIRSFYHSTAPVPKHFGQGERRRKKGATRWANCAAVYVRMSTEHQQYSTSNQMDVIREYAKKQGFTIV